MQVKYWTRAGLMLTDWCNASCACCYANCSPRGGTWLTAEAAIAIWESLAQVSPHGWRIHLTGGEPFGRFELLLQVGRLARQKNLALESIETNAFWADNDYEIIDRLEALDEAGMDRLAISADPYHQQFVPIERVRRLATLAKEVLGSQRVRVRWEDWLAEGRDTFDLSDDDRLKLFQEYASGKRDRLIGRAARGLERNLPKFPPEVFDGDNCVEKLLRGRHVHIAPTGEVWPATCIGICLGNVLKEPARTIWERLESGWAQMSILGPLCRCGPVGLMDEAIKTGYVPRSEGYAGKCQLCYDLRLHFLRKNVQPWRNELGPASVYDSSENHGGGGEASCGAKTDELDAL